MKKKEKYDFIVKFLGILPELQNMVPRLEYNFLHGKIVFDNQAIDIKTMFDSYAFRKPNYYEAMEQYAEEIGDMVQYYMDREPFYIDKPEREVLFYIHLPEGLYNVLYGMSDMNEKTQKKVEKRFNKFFEENGLEYDLGEWDKNSIFVYRPS